MRVKPGRFKGGSANHYDYANADPINQTDLTGACIPCVVVGVAVAGRVAIAAVRASRAGRAAKGATDGIYVIKGPRGTYVGQSGNIPRRAS